MEDILIICVLLAILIGAVTVRVRRAGKKGCCGSAGDYRPKKKKLKNIAGSRSFAVSQMHCAHCADRVTEIVNDMPGLTAQVDWKSGKATVFYERELPEQELLSRWERAGYPATPIGQGEQTHIS